MAKEKDVERQRSKSGKARRVLTTALAAALLLPSVLIPGKNTVEGAGHANIVGVDYFADPTMNRVPRPTLELSDGRTIFMRDSALAFQPEDKNVLQDWGTDYIKYLHFNTAESGYAARLTTSGEFFVRKDQFNDPSRAFSKWAEGWKDFVYLNYAGGYSFFGLKNDGNVVAIGSGTMGELGTGVKQSTSVPMEVLNPDTNTPLTGVKKIIQVDPVNVLFVTDSEIYKIGRAFGSSSFDNAKPIKVTSLFPGFNGADSFEMGYVGKGMLGTIDTINSNPYADVSLRYFLINGSYYTLTDTSTSSKYTLESSGYSEMNSNRLYPFNGDPTKTVRSLYQQEQTNGGRVYTANAENTFFEIESNGNLVTWGFPIDQIGYQSFDRSKYSTSKSLLIPNASKVSVNPNAAISIVAALATDGNVYVVGNNGNTWAGGPNVGITGISGVINAPTKLTGPDGAIENITDLAMSSSAMYLLKNTGDVYVFARDTSSIYKNKYNKTTGTKFVGLLEIKRDVNKSVVYGIDETGVLHLIDEAGNTTPQTGATGIYPPGYTPGPTTIDKPTEGMRSTDKFENTIITLEYPTVANKKEYSLDNGATWLDYTAPITLTNKGMINVKARAGLDSLYSEILDISFMNNPIVIPAGYPKLLEQDGVLTIDTGSIDLNRVKVQVDIDGQVSDYTSPVLLQEGDYVARAIIQNQNGEELTRVTENITVDPPAPGTLTAPVGTVGDLDANNQRQLTIGFNPTQGSLQIQHDGGPWVDEPEILNQYSGTTEDPSATERKFTLFVDNVVDSVYKARVTDGVNFSSETLLVVTSQVYDPSFFRDIDDKLLIDFSNLPTGSWYKEYSVDQGSTYHEYTGPIDIGAALPIKVRVTDTGSGQVLIEKEYITPALNGTNPNPNPNPGVDPSWGTEVTAADQEAILNVIGGGLSSKFNGLLLDNIEIQTVNQYQTINSVTNTLIEDSSGSGDGWTYSLSVTDFVSDPVLDTGLGTQDLVVKIPASAMNVDVKSAKVLAGSPDQTAKVGNYVLGSQKQALAQANPFEGMGYYDIPMDFMFRVPSTVEVVSMGSGSAHQVGDKVGLRVGVYRSLFTFSLAKGI